MNTMRSKFVGSLFLVGLVLVSGLGVAAETSNGNAPWITGINGVQSFRGDVQYQQVKGAGGVFINFDNISPSGDIDYQMATCQNSTVKTVGITFTHAQGDLDIQVFDVNGNLIGTSQGVGNSESVNVGSRAVVIMKVFGFGGATNPTYTTTVGC